MERETFTLPKFSLKVLLHFQLFPDLMLLIYHISMDIHYWTNGRYAKSTELKVIHGIGTFNILLSTLSIVVLRFAIKKRSLSLAAFYTRFKGTLYIISIPIENLYLDYAENPKEFSTTQNHPADSLADRHSIRSCYYFLLTLHIIGMYKYQQILRDKMPFQPISLKRYLEGIYVKYWIYFDTLVNINYFAARILNLSNIFWAYNSNPLGNSVCFLFYNMIRFIHHIAAFIAAYSVFKRNKTILKACFYTRFAVAVITLIISIFGGDTFRGLHRATITRGIIPQKFSKIFYDCIWLPVAHVHYTMVLASLYQFIEQLEDEQKSRDKPLYLNSGSEYCVLNGKEWKLKLKSLDKEDKKAIAKCQMDTWFLKIDPSNCLGSGQFGLVYKGQMGNFSNMDVAIKISNVEMDQDFFTYLLREFKKLLLIGDHQHIVKFHGFFRCTYSKFGNLGVVQEYCGLGSLLLYLKVIRHQNLSAKVICTDLNRFAYETAKGLEYLSSKQIIHGDVACRNILLTGDKTVKITDFGMSLNLYNYEHYPRGNQQLFPWKSMSPEALTDLQFSIQSDVWSYGVLLWEMFTLGQTPYPGLSWNSAFVQGIKRGMRLEKPAMASEEMYHMMLNCWEYEPQMRITFAKVIQTFEKMCPKSNQANETPSNVYI